MIRRARNVQDLAQLALTLVFSRRAKHGAEDDERGMLGSRELTVALVVEITKAMVQKIQQVNQTRPGVREVTSPFKRLHQ